MAGAVASSNRRSCVAVLFCLPSRHLLVPNDKLSCKSRASPRGAGADATRPRRRRLGGVRGRGAHAFRTARALGAARARLLDGGALAAAAAAQARAGVASAGI